MTDITETLVQKEICRHQLDTLLRLVNDVVHHPSSIGVEKVNIKIRDLDNLLSSYKSSLFRILAHPEHKQTKEDLLAELDIFDEDIVELKRLTNKPPFSVESTHDDPSFLNTAFTSQRTADSSNFARLPKLDLQPFNGALENWQPFFDIFNSTVHDNDMLQPVQKFQYLRTCLRDQPLALIQNLKLTDANYEVALQMLRDKYQQKRLISTLHILAIDTIPPLKDASYKSVDRFLSTIKEHLAALRALNEANVEDGKALAVILANKLERSIRNRFEALLNKDELPSIDQLVKFLETYITSQQWQTLEQPRSSTFKPRSPPRNKSHNYRSPPRRSFVTMSNQLSCIKCKQPHKLYTCQEFLNMSPKDRFLLVKENHHCFNCLAPNHKSDRCKSNHNCRKCNNRHNTLLHFGSNNSSTHSSKDNLNTSSSDQPIRKVLVSTSKPTFAETQNLLSTAVIYIQDSAECWQKVRVLLDSGSEISLITDQCRKQLGLNASPSQTSLAGIADTKAGACKGVVQCHLRSCVNRNQYSVKAFIVEKICSRIPSVNIDPKTVLSTSGLNLADPNCFKSGPVDMLLGTDIYLSLLTGLPRKLSDSGPYAVDTTLGVVLSGPLPANCNPRVFNQVNLTIHDNNEILNKFIELEDIPKFQSSPTEDETKADHMFSEKHSRNSQGRYIVPLLFKNEPPILGDSFQPALKCYRSLVSRLAKNQTLQEEYIKFMKDYLDSGHMIKVNDFHFGRKGYFIPHHAVTKQVGDSLKLRVVFNASKSSSNGVSLNDTLLPGPALQVDLPQVVMRQRLHPILLTADIRQMFRQVLIDHSQRQYQKILWNFDLSMNPQVYQLNTVTYGTTCAPYLAIRTLHQLVEDEGKPFPLASEALKHDTFVDDIITGAENIEAAQRLKIELISLLAKAGMELRKWASNSDSLLDDLPTDHKAVDNTISLDRDNSIKILGLMWEPSIDAFGYHITLPESMSSKRQLMSEAARIFDPLGWLSPITMIPKLIIRELWLLGLDWDEPVPSSIDTRWQEFKQLLPFLRKVSIPRFVRTTNMTLDLIGFCDASEKGYAAVVYIRSSRENDVQISLILAKTKVAPIKQETLPRLELCAAYHLARLLDVIKNSLPLQFHNTFLFSDSTVALAWIRSPCHLLKTFVANRVSQIQQLTKINDWYHVRSADNPADCASRGISPSELPTHSLWWNGPCFLQSPISKWPLDTNISASNEIVESEVRRHVLVTQANEENDIFSKFSSYDRLLRITALCLRFFNNCRSPDKRQFGPLTATELQTALSHLVKSVQLEHFGEQIDKLQEYKTLTKSLQKLDPFLDKSGLLRVGGRLSYSTRKFHEKHPLLLPANHVLTTLIITYYHEKYFHASPRNVQNLILRKFWILGARNRIRHICSKCVKCFKYNPRFIQPMMGDLPQHRVTPLKPFEAVGIDYGGPFLITPLRGRGYRKTKAYLCLFICFATKAVHLELASDLTTEMFINAFKRFIARRGRCSHIYSDCGTNFLGAKAYFSDLQKMVASNSYNEYVANQLSLEGIQWHINPPSAPHFGGLWEAAIKSVKFHLYRVVGEQILTYEEFNTVLCQIEAILNSRPLGPLSDDPSDCDVLTPSHFLTMEPAVCLPEPNSGTIHMEHLTRWKLIQRLVQDFWKKWNLEYLNTLQQRHKWNRKAKALTLNQLVLIKDDNLPPQRWKLGRVTKLSPGKDGVIRVATVKTASSSYIRPVVKLAPLPLDVDVAS